MQARYSLPLRWGMWALFSKVTYDPQHAARVAELQGDGIVVYVLRGHSVWPTLCLNYILQRRRLPLAACVAGINFFWLQSRARLWAYLRQRRMPARGPWSPADPAADTAPQTPRQPIHRREAILMQHILCGLPASVGLPTQHADGAPPGDLGDYLRALLLVARFCERPIYLLPHVLVDRHRGGPLRGLARLWTLRHAALRMAPPICLQKILQEAAAGPGPHEDEVRLARRLRAQLQRQLDDEERVVAGPAPSPYAATVREVLAHPQVLGAIDQENARSGRTDLALEAQAQRLLRGIAARYDVRIIQAMDALLRLLFWRIYDGVWVDQPGLAKVVETARRGPLIFCPAHRSHVDYLVLSYVLWQQGLSPPHIAAGQNLSFFPLGSLFRRCGAFFMRRTFAGDPLYSAVFAAYLFDLLKRGTSIEFFLEGTRSRSGKVRMPRLGLLRMLVDAWRAGARSDITFIPVSIDYDRIIEASAYTKELQGDSKKSENIGDLLRSGKVLRSRYGQVQVQFGAPISLASMAAEAGLSTEMPPATQATAWRQTVERLGFRILHQVAQVGSVTATALVSTALLGHRGRAMAQHKLLARCDAIVHFLSLSDARLAPALQRPNTRVSAVLEAVQKLVDDRLAVVERAGADDQEPLYFIPAAHRITLDYSKNALINHFVPCAFLARSLCLQPEPRRRSVALEDCRFLSQLFRYEFLFRADANFASNFELASAQLRGLDAITEGATEDGLERRSPEVLEQFSALLDSFCESYWQTARTVFDLRSLALSEVDLQKRALERLRRAYLEGEIARPEAVSQPLVGTALSSLVQMGVLDRRTEGGDGPTLQLCPAFGEDALQHLVARLRSFVRPL
jgi:glycerol-3-phosphate O-acyltransferase